MAGEVSGRRRGLSNLAGRRHPSTFRYSIECAVDRRGVARLTTGLWDAASERWSFVHEATWEDMPATVMCAAELIEVLAHAILMDKVDGVD